MRSIVLPQLLDSAMWLSVLSSMQALALPSLRRTSNCSGVLRSFCQQSGPSSGSSALLRVVPAHADGRGDSHAASGQPSDALPAMRLNCGSTFPQLLTAGHLLRNGGPQPGSHRLHMVSCTSPPGLHLHSCPAQPTSWPTAARQMHAEPARDSSGRIDSSSLSDRNSSSTSDGVCDISHTGFNQGHETSSSSSSNSNSRSSWTSSTQHTPASTSRVPRSDELFMRRSPYHAAEPSPHPPLSETNYILSALLSTSTFDQLRDTIHRHADQFDGRHIGASAYQLAALRRQCGRGAGQTAILEQLLGLLESHIQQTPAHELVTMLKAAAALEYRNPSGWALVLSELERAEHHRLRQLGTRSLAALLRALNDADVLDKRTLQDALGEPRLRALGTVINQQLNALISKQSTTSSEISKSRLFNNTERGKSNSTSSDDSRASRVSGSCSGHSKMDNGHSQLRSSSNGAPYAPPGSGVAAAMRVELPCSATGAVAVAGGEELIDAAGTDTELLEQLTACTDIRQLSDILTAHNSNLSIPQLCSIIVHMAKLPASDFLTDVHVAGPEPGQIPANISGARHAFLKLALQNLQPQIKKATGPQLADFLYSAAGIQYPAAEGWSMLLNEVVCDNCAKLGDGSLESISNVMWAVGKAHQCGVLQTALRQEQVRALLDNATRRLGMMMHPAHEQYAALDTVIISKLLTTLGLLRFRPAGLIHLLQQEVHERMEAADARFVASTVWALAKLTYLHDNPRPGLMALLTRACKRALEPEVRSEMVMRGWNAFTTGLANLTFLDTDVMDAAAEQVVARHASVQAQVQMLWSFATFAYVSPVLRSVLAAVRADAEKQHSSLTCQGLTLSLWSLAVLGLLQKEALVTASLIRLVNARWEAARTADAEDTELDVMAGVSLAHVHEHHVRGFQVRQLLQLRMVQDELVHALREGGDAMRPEYRPASGTTAARRSASGRERMRGVGGSSAGMGSTVDGCDTMDHFVMPQLSKNLLRVASAAAAHKNSVDPPSISKRQQQIFDLLQEMVVPQSCASAAVSAVAAVPSSSAAGSKATGISVRVGPIARRAMDAGLYVQDVSSEVLLSDSGVSSTDIVVQLWGGRRIAVEVDGLQHFACNDITKPLAKTVLRNRMLERKYGAGNWVSIWVPQWDQSFKSPAQVRAQFLVDTLAGRDVGKRSAKVFV